MEKALARVRKRNQGGDLPSWTAQLEPSQDGDTAVVKNFQFFSDSKEVHIGALVVLKITKKKNRFGKEYYKASLLTVKEEE